MIKNFIHYYTTPLNPPLTGGRLRASSSPPAKGELEGVKKSFFSPPPAKGEAWEGVIRKAQQQLPIVLILLLPKFNFAG